MLQFRLCFPTRMLDVSCGSFVSELFWGCVKAGLASACTSDVSVLLCC